MEVRGFRQVFGVMFVAFEGPRFLAINLPVFRDFLRLEVQGLPMYQRGLLRLAFPLKIVKTPLLLALRFQIYQKTGLFQFAFRVLRDSLKVGVAEVC